MSSTVEGKKNLSGAPTPRDGTLPRPTPLPHAALEQTFLGVAPPTPGATGAVTPSVPSASAPVIIAAPVIAVLADPPAQSPTLEQAPLTSTLSSPGASEAGASGSATQPSATQPSATQPSAPLLRAETERTLLHASPGVDPRAVPAAAAPRAPWPSAAKSEATLQVFSAEPKEERTPSLPPSGHASDRTLMSSEYLRRPPTAGSSEDGAGREASAHTAPLRSHAAGAAQPPALPRPTGPMGTMLEVPSLAESPEASALPALPSGARGSVAPRVFSPGFQPVTPTRTQLNDGIGSLSSSSAQVTADWNLQDTHRPPELPPLRPATSRAWRIGWIGLSALALAGIGWAVVYLRVADRGPPTGEQTTLANHPAPATPNRAMPAPAAVPGEPTSTPQIRPVPSAVTRGTSPSQR